MWWERPKKKEVVANVNPLKELDKKCKEYKTLFDQWVVKQSLPVAASVTTVAGAAPGAALGVCLASLVDHVLPVFNLPPRPTTSQTNRPGCPPSLVPYQPIISGGTLAQARNFAVLTSVNAGISCVMKRLRGKQDFETCMIAGFGSGVMSSLVAGMRGPSVIPVGVFFALLSGGTYKTNIPGFPSSLVPYQPIISGGTLAQARNFAVLTSVNAGISCVMKRLRGKQDFETCMIAGFGSGVMSSLVAGMRGPSVIPVGVFFALLSGGAYKVKEKKVKERSLSQQANDADYRIVKRMLSNLGLTQYEKNFKKAMLDDLTFTMFTEITLQEMGIPPRERLLILDEREFNKLKYLW